MTNTVTDVTIGAHSTNNSTGSRCRGLTNRLGAHLAALSGLVRSGRGLLSRGGSSARAHSTVGRLRSDIGSINRLSSHFRRLRRHVIGNIRSNRLSTGDVNNLLSHGRNVSRRVGTVGRSHNGMRVSNISTHGAIVLNAVGATNGVGSTGVVGPTDGPLALIGVVG